MSEITAPKPQIRLVIAAVFIAALAQMSLNPVIAPLSRELRLASWQLGLIISIAAIMLVLTSGFWGRQSTSWGRKRVLVLAMSIGAVAMLGFAALAAFGPGSDLSQGTLFWLMVATRGVLFGAALAAMAPTAQAYVANVTASEEARVRGMAGVGAAQGFAMIGGAALGGLLSAFGLLTPVIAVPIILIVGVVVLAIGLRPEPAAALTAHPKPVRPWDRRIWPFLVAEFGVLSALGFLQIVSGFIVQDRLGLSAADTGLVNGGALLLAGAGLIVAQAALVPRLRKPPEWFLKFGTALACVGVSIILFDAGPTPILAGMFITGIGVGCAMPGYTAGASLRVAADEQGGIAGLIGAVSGLTFVVAPTASTALYDVWSPLPLIIGATFLAAVALFSFTHRAFRARPEELASAQPAGETA